MKISFTKDRNCGKICLNNKKYISYLVISYIDKNGTLIKMFSLFCIIINNMCILHCPWEAL